MLADIPGWGLAHGKLHRELEFASFVEAFGFMSMVALIAERANDHPEWSNVYNRVRVDFTTHSVKGISDYDFELARKINAASVSDPTVRVVSFNIRNGRAFDGWNSWPFRRRATARCPPAFAARRRRPPGGVSVPGALPRPPARRPDCVRTRTRRGGPRRALPAALATGPAGSSTSGFGGSPIDPTIQGAGCRTRRIPV